MRLVNKVTVTYRNRTVGTLSMTPDNRLCAFQNGRPTFDDMIAVGESIRIPRKKGMDMILSIASGCSEILSKDYDL